MSSVLHIRLISCTYTVVDSKGGCLIPIHALGIICSLYRNLDPWLHKLHTLCTTDLTLRTALKYHRWADVRSANLTPECPGHLLISFSHRHSITTFFSPSKSKAKPIHSEYEPEPLIASPADQAGRRCLVEINLEPETL